MNLSNVPAAAVPEGPAAASSFAGPVRTPGFAARTEVGTEVATEVAVLLLADVSAGSRLWGWSRIVRGPGALRRTPGLRLAKVLGSGYEGGFGLRPSASRQGLFVVFESEALADRFIESASIVEAFRQRSNELCVIKLRAFSSRGSWGGASLAVSAPPPATGPVAALTRASIRLPAAAEFWRKAPAAQASLAAAPGCLLAAGLGEAPLLRQATFSIWESASAMDAYARSGAHLDAIRASHQGNFFSESMFVRFLPLSIQGSWLGVLHG
jgi:hypothetical protein